MFQLNILSCVVHHSFQYTLYIIWQNTLGEIRIVCCPLILRNMSIKSSLAFPNFVTLFPKDPLCPIMHRPCMNQNSYMYKYLFVLLIVILSFTNFRLWHDRSWYNSHEHTKIKPPIFSRQTYGTDRNKGILRPRRDKTCLRGFWQSEIRTSLLSYRD